MTLNELHVEAEEQQIILANNFVANLRFDYINKRWYYDLYKEGGMVAAGVLLLPDSFPLLHVQPTSLGLVDVGDKLEDYEPYYALGNRLKLIEIQE